MTHDASGCRGLVLHTYKRWDLSDHVLPKALSKAGRRPSCFSHPPTSASVLRESTSSGSSSAALEKCYGMVKLLCNQDDTATFPQGIQQSSCSDPLPPVPVGVRHSWFKQQRTFTCLLLRADHLSALGLTAQARHSCTLH